LQTCCIEMTRIVEVKECIYGAALTCIVEQTPCKLVTKFLMSYFGFPCVGKVSDSIQKYFAQMSAIFYDLPTIVLETAWPSK